MNPIELTGVDKSFQKRTALRGVDLTVSAGTLVGFIGPNGSGKTTCLRILLGLLRADAGTVRVLGMNPQNDAVRIRQHVCYLPGEASLYQHMRGAEFLHFALRFYPRLQADLMSRLSGAFQLPLQKKIREYSAGMKQKLALMATLIPDVELYLLDEPDRALDATTRFFLRDVLRDLRDAGKTFLMSSHHLQDVASVADDLVFLFDGERIPDDRIESARAVLQRRVRIRLSPDAPLPHGAAELFVSPDGVRHVEPKGDLADWLATVPREHLVAAELGTVHLEDLYRILMEDEPS